MGITGLLDELPEAGLARHDERRVSSMNNESGLAILALVGNPGLAHGKDHSRQAICAGAICNQSDFALF